VRATKRRIAHRARPVIARRYWKLSADATLRDVVIAVRADEADHRDVNHGRADELRGGAGENDIARPL